MATIRRRNKKYQVQVRKSSHKSISKTFTDLKTAKIWANHIEDKIELGDEFVKQDNKLILRDIIQRYLNEITSQKKGKESEQRRIKRLLKEPLCDEKNHTLKTKNFVEYKSKRIKDGKRTCHYDLVLLRHMYNVAINQWNLIKIENPLINVPKPKLNPPRESRLTEAEYTYLVKGNYPQIHLRNIIELAIETAMRRGKF